MKKLYTLVPIFLFTMSIFVGCGKKESHAAATGPSLCPSDSGMNATEALVCKLYREFPPQPGPDSRKPTPAFGEYFVSDLRNPLGKLKTLEAVLYQNIYTRLEDLSGFTVKFHERSGKLEVRYRVYERLQKIDFVMGKQNGKWLVTDIRYPDDPSAVSLRECLRPHVNDPTALTADYNTARRRYKRLAEAFNGGWERFPEDKQNAMFGEKNRLLGFLSDHLKDVVGEFEIEGYHREDANNLDNCVYDQNICTNLDGVRFTSEHDGEIVVTTRDLLRQYVGNDNSSLDPDRLAESELFTEILIQEAQFIGMGNLAVEKPEGLDFLRVRFGYTTQDGTGAYLPGSVYFVAARGNRVFLGGLYFEEDAFSRIPPCEAGYKQGLEAQGYECEEFYCRGQDSTNVSVFQAAEKTYATCYAEAMVNEPFYPNLLAKMQSIVDRVAAAH